MASSNGNGRTPLIRAEGIWKIFGKNAGKVIGTPDAELSRTVTVKPVGALVNAGSCESERWVFAMQIGRSSSPSLVNSSILARAAGRRKIPSAP